MEINDSKFVYQGSTYENRYGIYLCNRRLISKEEYHRALSALRSQEEEDTLSYRANQYSRDFSQHTKDFYDFIDNLTYDKEYATTREKRGHLPRLSPYDEEARIKSIIEDTSLSEAEAKEVNKILLEYTSTNNYTRFSNAERELFDRYIDEAPIYYPPPVFRGMGFDYDLGSNDRIKYFSEYANIGIGDLISMRDYTSFASNPDLPIKFANEHGSHLVYLCNTKNLSGVSIDHMSSLEYLEDELVYKKDIKMKVLKKEIKGTVVYLQVEELPLEEYGDYDNIHVLPESGSNISDHDLLKSKIYKSLRRR